MIKIQLNLNKKIEKFPPRIVERILNYTGVEGEKLTKKQTKVDTGRLRSSVTYQISDNVLKIGSNVKYAPFILGDVGPYVIRPRKRKALRFKIGNEYIFSKKVNHPGAYGVLSKVKEELQRKYIPEIIKKVLNGG